MRLKVGQVLGELLHAAKVLLVEHGSRYRLPAT
jgi:hypothetical protein